MKTLPLIDKNAYLSIYLTKGYIYSALAYSHYDIGRKYVLTDITPIDLSSDPLESKEFWKEFFTGLEDKFGWDIFGKSQNPFSLNKIINFVDEGEGVAAIQLNISDLISDRGWILAGLREFLPEIQIKVIDKPHFANSLSKVAQKSGYNDLLYLDLNLERFELYRVSSISKTKEGNTYISAKIGWDNKESLIETVFDARLRAFAGVDIDSGNGVNIWANYVLKPVLKPKAGVLMDIIRAFTTVQLLSIYNNQPEIVDNFGVANTPALIIVGGELINTIKKDHVMLAILDGLQLRGSFDLLFDPESLIRTIGAAYGEGINSKEFIVSEDQVLRKATRVFIPEIPGRGNEKKVVFDGTMTDEIDGLQPVFGLTSSIFKKNFNKEAKRTILEGKFVKGAYIEGKEEPFELIFEKEDLVKGIVVDCRFKPVIYGPDYRANIDNLASWLNE